MKVTVDVPEKSLSDILRFSGEQKKGPAIAKLLEQLLMFHRRQEMLNQVRLEKLRVDFPKWESVRSSERTLNPWTK